MRHNIVSIANRSNFKDNFLEMLTKQKVLKSFREMPDEFSIDEAIDKLIIINKVQKAENEITDGKGLSTAEARKKLKKWLS